MDRDNRRNIAFYDRLAAEYGLFFHDLRENMKQEGKWLAEILAPHKPFAVLDASCGSGRQAIPLARLGHRVTAADPSAAMLDVAREEARLEGVEVRWLQAGFLELPTAVNATFDAVIALGNGLCNQESPSEILDALRSLRLCTAPSGVCLVGIRDYDALRVHCDAVHGHGVHDNEGTRTILFDVWEVQEPHLLSTSFLVRGADDQWRVETASTKEYMLREHELRVLAHEAGFQRVERLDHPNESVYLLAPDPPEAPNALQPQFAPLPASRRLA